MFGDRLQELRTAHNLTQVQMADQLGVSKQSISNWENGNIMPSVDMLITIADHFSVSIDYILDRTNDTYLKIEGLSSDQRAYIQKMIRYLQLLNQKLSDAPDQ